MLVVLNGLCEIRKSARSKNHSYKYKADHILFFRVPLGEEQYTYWPVVTFISRIFLLVDSYIFDSLRESENLQDKKASLTQEVKYSKVNPLCFKILIRISPAVVLFEGNPSITSFTVSTLTS